MAMTAEQARTFAGVSTGNALLLAAEAQRRGCRCVPYHDWYTYARWRAQGYHVRRGEHGVRLTTYVERETRDEDGEIIGVYRRPWVAHVFCRCQVDRII